MPLSQDSKGELCLEFKPLLMLLPFSSCRAHDLPLSMKLRRLLLFVSIDRKAVGDGCSRWSELTCLPGMVTFKLFML